MDAPGSGVSPATWALPLAGGDAQGLYLTYSLIVATFLGTMGLPHVVVRFYTNPDGRAARRTTLVVLALLGLFYLLPPVYGALGRVYADALVASGRTDVLVLELPRLMVPGPLGELLTALVTAGAFAAFLSTSSGLAIAVGRRAGPGRHGRPIRGRRLSGIAAFRAGCASSRSPSRACWPCCSRASGWPGRWAWPSRSPPRPSARCWCWASGGAG